MPPRRINRGVKRRICRRIGIYPQPLPPPRPFNRKDDFKEALNNGSTALKQIRILTEYAFVSDEIRDKKFPCITSLELLTVSNGITMEEFDSAWMQEHMFPITFKASYHCEQMMKVAEGYDVMYYKFQDLLRIIYTNEEDYNNET